MLQHLADSPCLTLQLCRAVCGALSCACFGCQADGFAGDGVVVLDERKLPATPSKKRLRLFALCMALATSSQSTRGQLSFTVVLLGRSINGWFKRHGYLLWKACGSSARFAFLKKHRDVRTKPVPQAKPAGPAREKPAQISLWRRWAEGLRLRGTQANRRQPRPKTRKGPWAPVCF